MTPPAQSPGLNVIENLWALLENNFRKHNITSKEDMKKVLTEEWSKIGAETTQKLVDSMPSRPNEVIEAKETHLNINMKFFL